MQGKFIKDLDELSSVSTDDVIPIFDTSENVTKKVQTQNLGLNISNLTEVDSISDTDKIPILDVSTGNNKYVEAGDLGLNLTNLTELTSIANNDQIPIRDVSGLANKYVQVVNLPTNINNLTSLDAVPADTDKLIIYDNSDGINKKINYAYLKQTNRLRARYCFYKDGSNYISVPDQNRIFEDTDMLSDNNITWTGMPVSFDLVFASFVPTYINWFGSVRLYSSINGAEIPIILTPNTVNGFSCYLQPVSEIYDVSYFLSDEFFIDIDITYYP